MSEEREANDLRYQLQLALVGHATNPQLSRFLDESSRMKSSDEIYMLQRALFIVAPNHQLLKRVPFNDITYQNKINHITTHRSKLVETLLFILIAGVISFGIAGLALLSNNPDLAFKLGMACLGLMGGSVILGAIYGFSFY